MKKFSIYPAKNCLKCHLDYKQLTTAYDLDPHVINSSCGSCHTIHEHEFKNEKCGDCHPDIVDEFGENPNKHMQIDCDFCHLKHGMKPPCTYCHTSHTKGDCLGCHIYAHDPIASV